MQTMQTMQDYSYIVNEHIQDKKNQIQFSSSQNEAISILTKKKSRILGHQAGLGKTLTMLAVAKLYRVRNPLVTTVFFFPKSASAAFLKEMNNRIKEPYALYSCTRKIIPYEGQAYLLIESTYLKKAKDLIIEISKERPLACFFDEAHTCSDKSTKMFSDFMSIRQCFQVFHPVTATPLINSFENFFNLLQMVDPYKWDSFSSFRDKYCVTRTKDTNVTKWIFKQGKRQKISFTVPVVEIIDYKNLDDLQLYVDSIMITGAKKYNLRFFYKKTKRDLRIEEQYWQAAKGKFDREKIIDDLEDILRSKGIEDFPIPKRIESSEDSLDQEKEKEKEKEKEDTAHGARLHNLQRIIDGSYCYQKTTKIQLLLDTLKQINTSGDGASLVYVEYDDSVELLKYWLSKESLSCGINKIHILSGKVKEKDRVLIEQTLEAHDVVIVTSAGKQSRNLQRANNFLFYNLPFSVGTIIQCIGRICRTDTKFKNQDIYILEVEETIDTYKRVLFQDNVNLISMLFSDQTTLPMEMMKVEQKTIDYLKQKLLWMKR